MSCTENTFLARTGQVYEWVIGRFLEVLWSMQMIFHSVSQFFKNGMHFLHIYLVIIFKGCSGFCQGIAEEKRELGVQTAS